MQTLPNKVILYDSHMTNLCDLYLGVACSEIAPPSPSPPGL